LRDPSAIVVCQADRRDTGRTEEVKRFPDGSAWVSPVFETGFLVRHVERLPLRTPFRKVGQRVREVVEGLDRIAADLERGLKVNVMCDRTGLGLPATEEIREELGTAVPVSGVDHGGRGCHGVPGS